ncbi:hypothetical protein HanLR1_Chr17g0663791 [Helianthus annuus]|nr:hypothetical protein HanLR1_Chr17g0663791 [Helianthus annuus]
MRMVVASSTSALPLPHHPDTVVMNSLDITVVALGSLFGPLPFGRWPASRFWASLAGLQLS